MNMFKKYNLFKKRKDPFIYHYYFVYSIKKTLLLTWQILSLLKSVVI